eukprot:TRINITY_DN6933_c0_g1_i1.p1 TRINITY_DN6933_c0_g1~~TRINITY_DN6933_c0_g1_i1.p1  ORF type:complete len:126 (+),score=20.07 TRINITY_DN6933_c0_g1_i1:66-443(+)
MPSQALSYWLYFVSSLGLFGSVQGFFRQQTLKDKQFSKAPRELTGLAGRLFGAWTAVATMVRFSCASAPHERTLQLVGMGTFLVAGGIYVAEVFVYKTVPFKNALAPFIVASTSFLWMLKDRLEN